MMDGALIIALITAAAAIIQARHANVAAAEANRVAKQELESVTKCEPKLHFAIGADHSIFSQVWNGHGQFVEAMCNSLVVMPSEVKPIFTGERALGSYIKQKKLLFITSLCSMALKANRSICAW